MRRLIRFLVYRMQTLDGQKGTAEPLVNAIYKQELDDVAKSKQNLTK